MNEAYLETALCFNPVLSKEGAWQQEDGSWRLVIEAPEAKEISIRLDEKEYPFSRDGEGKWTLEFRPEPGFWFFFLKIDGANVVHPAFPIGFGYSRPMNFLNVPGDDDFWLCRDVPHGFVVQDYYPSKVTGRTESCLVYLPPRYFTDTKKYPVLYLQHGHGENEACWIHQGKTNWILDNLLAEGKAKEMIVVMANGMVQVDGQVRSERFTQLLVEDLIPFVEGRYRASSRREDRAMAGLSMGSVQTSITTMTHPELFAYIGLFSGFLRNIFPDDNVHLKAMDDAEKFGETYKVFFRGCGDRDQFLGTFLEDDEIVKQKGVREDRHLYHGGHVWGVWRECLRDFVPQLFRD